MEEKNVAVEMPSVEIVEKEVQRLDYRARFWDALRTTLYTFITVVAFALLIATLFLPVLQVYGNYMDPTVPEDTFVLCTKTGHPTRGSVLAFYYNNKILVRRVIGLPGDVIDMDDQGYVSVNQEPLEEDYVTMHALGASNRQYPYVVPEGEYFVMADNRAEGIDSRVDVVGCVMEEEFIGVVRLKVWPLDEIGIVR